MRSNRTVPMTASVERCPHTIDMFSEYAAEMYVDEVLDGAGNFLHLDSKVSVSALDEATRGDHNAQE